ERHPPPRVPRRRCRRGAEEPRPGRPAARPRARRQRRTPRRLRQRLHQQPLQGQPRAVERAGGEGRHRPGGGPQLRRRELLHRARGVPDHPRHRRAGRGGGRLRRGRRRGLLDRADRPGQPPPRAARRGRRRCGGAHHRRRSTGGRGDHDDRLRPQAGRGRARRLERRRHGQGGWDARPAARHDARGPHHRRGGGRRDRRRRPARGDPGLLRPARLRRLHVDERHRDAAVQRRQRGGPGRRRLHRGGHRGLSRPGPAAARRRRGGRPRDRRHRHRRGERGRRRRGRAQHRPEQPVQGRGVRARPQLGPGARQHRDDPRALRPRGPRRDDERRPGVHRLRPRRAGGPRRPRGPAGGRARRPQERRCGGDGVDQRPHPRLRPRELRVQQL
ncbi:MAG: Glutamate N-acetyltransferase @ N-acetylglutamate synthase, partial [uncultured Nocardioidaceae bacterium]